MESGLGLEFADINVLGAAHTTQFVKGSWPWKMKCKRSV